MRETDETIQFAKSLYENWQGYIDPEWDLLDPLSRAKWLKLTDHVRFMFQLDKPIREETLATRPPIGWDANGSEVYDDFPQENV